MQWPLCRTVEKLSIPMTFELVQFNAPYIHVHVHIDVVSSVSTIIVHIYTHVHPCTCTVMSLLVFLIQLNTLLGVLKPFPCIPLSQSICQVSIHVHVCTCMHMCYYIYVHVQCTYMYLAETCVTSTTIYMYMYINLCSWRLPMSYHTGEYEGSCGCCR